MDSQIIARLDALEKKIDATYLSAEKTRKYILGMVIATVVTVVLPIVGLMLAVPAFMASYSGVAQDISTLDI